MGFSIMRSLRAVLLALLLLLLVVLICILVINYIVKEQNKKNIYFSTTVPQISYDAALVLGCGVYNNSTPSPLLQERLDTAIELYQEGVVDILLMSGDHAADNYNEVGVMKEYALDMGVPAGAIILDHSGFSTYESLYRAQSVFELENMVIVSQRYHLYRALHIANALGLNAHGVQADQKRLSGQTKRGLREILARNKDFFYSIIKPEI